MTRRLCFALLLVPATACTRKQNLLKDVLPVQVLRTWTLERTFTQDNASAKEMVRDLGLKRWITAMYKSNDEIAVDLYEMTNEAAAFEGVQKWDRSSGLIAYKGAFLVSVQANRNVTELAGFLQDLLQQIKA